MKVRGRRKCKECGHRWSYYDSGSVACPNCESLRSVGVDERTRHTDSGGRLDLADHRTAVEEGSVADEADGLKSTLREYVRRRGFVHAGDLLRLDDTFLAAHELLHAIDVYTRSRKPTEDEELYLLALLTRTDAGERLPPEEVPESMTAARGLGYANAVREYRGDALTYLDDNPDPAARRRFGRLAERVKRVRALQGDVPVEESEALVRVARELGTYLREDDDSALATATTRLDGLD
jgi:uncharacterized Zn finger protein (UPF0148 family)